MHPKSYVLVMSPHFPPAAFYLAWNSVVSPILTQYFRERISMSHVEGVMLTAVILILLQNSVKCTDVLDLYDWKWSECWFMESYPIAVSPIVFLWSPFLNRTNVTDSLTMFWRLQITKMGKNWQGRWRLETLFFATVYGDRKKVPTAALRDRRSGWPVRKTYCASFLSAGFYSASLSWATFYHLKVPCKGFWLFRIKEKAERVVAFSGF